MTRYLAVAALGLSFATAAHALPSMQTVRPAPEPEAVEQANPAHGALMAFLLESPEDEHGLRGARVAILAADGVDGFDLEVPRRHLQERGAHVDVIVPRKPGSVRTLGTRNPSGEAVEVTFDRYLDEVDPLAYHVVYLPGHRDAAPPMTDAATLAFVQQAVHAGLPVFAIGNGPLVLLQAGLLDQRRATGDAATFLRLALSTAAATDAPMVKDGSIYTSRDAFDLPQLMRQLIGELQKRIGK